jgi:protein-L-isoaspartate(D-aspartate) O-methyltransferase
MHHFGDCARAMCDDPAETTMHGPDSASYKARRGLVEKLRADGHLRSPRVAAAIEAVPRELFVPGLPLDEVYRPSDAIVTKRVDGISVSSASAPEVMALMLEQLDPRPGDRVLEIGAGTGYNAALLAHLVGEHGHVVTLDIDEDLVLSAREHLAEAGYSQVAVVQTDGALGHATGDKYDRIILTVASSDIAPAWREQLAQPHGRLVLPLSVRGPQRSVAFTVADDHLVSDSIRNCSFIPLRGVLASGSHWLPLEEEGGRVMTGAEEPLPLDVTTIGSLLRGRSSAFPTGVSTNLWEMRMGLYLWLVSHQKGVCTLWGGARVPDLFGMPDRAGARGTLCIMDSTSLVLLARSDESRDSSEVVVLASAGGDALALHVKALLNQWSAQGRPMDASLKIRAYPRGQSPAPKVRQVVVDQRWTTFLLSWEDQAPATFTV